MRWFMVHDRWKTVVLDVRMEVTETKTFDVPKVLHLAWVLAVFQPSCGGSLWR